MASLVRIAIGLPLFVAACLCLHAESVLSTPQTQTACASSPAEAARSVVSEASSPKANSGYRVHDLLVDPVLHKAWVRIADCSDARRPLTLVALRTTITGTGGDRAGNDLIAMPSEPAPISQTSATHFLAAPLIQRDASVEVLVQSSSVRMTLHGRATASAGAGEAIDVLLEGSSEPGQPQRHMHGIAVAAHRVEVLP